MNCQGLFLRLVLLSTGLIACDHGKKSSTSTLSDKMPKIVFADTDTYDFGSITEGDTIERNFKFRNEGKFPLIINNIHTSCGCTTPEWPHKPIKPGEESAIKVRFNSQGKRGIQNKSVSVYANTEPAMTEFSFRVLVKPQPDSNQPNSVH